MKDFKGPRRQGPFLEALKEKGQYYTYLSFKEIKNLFRKFTSNLTNNTFEQLTKQAMNDDKMVDLKKLIEILDGVESGLTESLLADY